jgi:hypothetical protein
MPGSDPDETQNTSAVTEVAMPRPSQAPEGPAPGPSASRMSVPPSEPRSSRASLSNLDSQIDAPARLQMIVALTLGLVLVAIPLYLWRRPRAESIAVSRSASSDGGKTSAVTTPPSSSEGDARITISEPRVLQCQDPGSKKTAPEQCDHLPEIEKAFAKAIEESGSCLPKEAGGGTVQYVADVSFKRKSISVTAPKDGRTLRSAKAAGACAAAVKGKLSVVALHGMTHQHARYKVSITATYPGAVK